MHPPRCPHACRTATACVPQPTQCPRQQRASEPHTPQAVAGVGLHMARHMKAASCRLLRSHAAVDGTPHRLMVPHTPPRPPWAAPRRPKRPTPTTCVRNCTIRFTRKSVAHTVLHPQVDDVAALPYAALPMPTHRARSPRTCITSPAPCLAGFPRDAVGRPGRQAEGQNHLDITKRRGNCTGVFGSPARAASQGSADNRWLGCWQ